MPNGLEGWNREMLEDLLKVRRSSAHPLQAVHCRCCAAAWVKARDVSQRQREVEVECPACGERSSWRIRRRAKTLEDRLNCVCTTKREPALRRIVSALARHRRDRGSS